MVLIDDPGKNRVGRQVIEAPVCESVQQHQVPEEAVILNRELLKV
jgi:hypothetical protein